MQHIIFYGVMYIIGACVYFEWQAGTLHIENPLFSIIAMLCLTAFLLFSVAILALIIVGILVGIFRLLQFLWNEVIHKPKPKTEECQKVQNDNEQDEVYYQLIIDDKKG